MTSSADRHHANLDTSPSYSVSSVNPEPYLYTGDTYMLNRQSSTASTDDIVCEGCENCCCSLCSILGCLLCCPTASYKARLRLLWVCLIIVAVIASCTVNFYVFARQNFETSPTDNRIVSKPGFGLFCRSGIFNSKQEYRVTSLPETPRINTSPASVIHYETSFSLDLSRKVVNVSRGFYLLKGTTIHVSPCSQYPGIWQYFIKGKSNINSMVDKRTCGSSCSVNSISTCDDQYHKRKFQYTISETDDYYFLYNSKSTPSNRLDVSFALNRTNYDYSQNDGEVFCASADYCTVRVPMKPMQTLVYRGQENSGFQVTLTVDCEIRITMYLLFFGLVPFLIGIIITCIIIGKFSQRGTGSSGQSLHEEDQMSRANVGSWMPPPYRDPPPKYEELVNEPEEPPPPYPGTQGHI